MTLPKDLYEAAMIDGCSRFGFLWRILVPLSGPPVVTLTIFAFLSNRNLLMRFKQETKAMHQLDHPNIIKIHDIGVDGKTVYYAMEYVQGQTLKELIHERYEIDKGTISSDEVLSIAMDLARALEYIHER